MFITSISLEPNKIYVYKTIYINNETYIVVTVYVLRIKDISDKGKVIPITCMMVGKIYKAKNIHIAAFTEKAERVLAKEC